jgi:hypothetical protein
LWWRGEEVLLDPGTFTYIGDPAERNWFRGTAAHNTIGIDGMDQAAPAGPFRWATKPEVELTAWEQTTESSFADAICRYNGLIHRRRILLEAERLLVLDEIEGPDGEHTCRQTWQLGQAADRVRFAFSGPASHEDSQNSQAYGQKRPSNALVAQAAGKFPLAMAMMLQLDGESSISVTEARAIFSQKFVTVSNLKRQT